MTADQAAHQAAGAGDSAVLHASCVAHAGRALLITGPSGAGKSTLALRMIALGALLVADDRTLVRSGRELTASCAEPSLCGLIEARGVGILRAPFAETAPLALVVDLGQTETQRLPPNRSFPLLGHILPLVLRPQNPHLAEAMLLYLAHGRLDPDA